ncbi:MAG: cation transporter [Clostridia bacterium]|nr:cation transporter [Clostridia bacterium]
MTKLLEKLFIKGNSREQYGVLSGMVGIFINLILSIMKIGIGLISGSISISADGLNNFSDAATSVITLIGFKLSSKPADKDHPFGHQRIEYITGLIVSFVIILIGFELIKSSVGKIINPTAVEFGIIPVIILIISIFMKLWLMLFNKKINKKLSSPALEATAADCRNDVITTFAVLLALCLGYILEIDLDGYMGVLVGGFIIISGISLVKETISPLLGEAADKETEIKIADKVKSYDGVLGIHDLVVHSYGAEKYYACVHAEVDAKEDILKSHDLIDNIERDMKSSLGIDLVIHMDPIVTDDKETNQAKELVRAIINELSDGIDFHDFRMVKGTTHCNLIFDVVVPYDYKMKDDQLCDYIQGKVREIYPDYFTVISVDKSYVN